MSKVSGDKIQFQNSETLDTPDTWDTRDTLDSEASNYFEPDCVRLARDSGTPEGLKLLLSYYRQRKYDEGGLIETARTYIVKHNLSISSNELLEILGETETFSCDYARSLGFCKRTCKLKLPPEKRLILELKSVIVWHSTSEISLRIGDLRKTLKLSQFWKKGKINPGIFDLLFIEAFLIPPTPPFTEETALRVFEEILMRAEHVKDPIDEEAYIEDAVLEILNKRPVFRIDDLKEGAIRPSRGFFWNPLDDTLYIESDLFFKLLEGKGIKSPVKVRRAVQHLLAGNTKRVRVKNERFSFWRFSVPKIRAEMRARGEKFEIEISEKASLELEVSKILKKEESGDDQS